MSFKHSHYLLAFLFLSSCGGGGGGGSSPSTPSAPLPSVTLSTSNSSVPTGQSTTLTWSSSNANSCSASGSWSGTKATSGSEEVSNIDYGSNTFSLSCTGAGGSSSASLTVSGTQAYDATAFVGSGSKVYKGFLIEKRDEYCASVATVEFELKGSSDASALMFSNASSDELQYICYYNTGDDAENPPTGISLSGQRLEFFEGESSISLPITADNLNGIEGIYLNTSIDIDPYNYEPQSLEELEQFTADLALDFQFTDEGGSPFDAFAYPDLQMAVYATPNSSPTDNTSSFIGYSEMSGSNYVILFLAEKELWESSPKTGEGDIFATNFAGLDLFASYQSLVSLIPNEYGFKVSTESYTSSDHILNTTYQGATLQGSRKANRILASDNSTWNECYHAFKYLFNSDVDSYQRFFLKMDTNLSGFSPCNNIVTAVNNYELFFFYPDGSGLIGFKLNGYDGGIEGQTNIRLFFNND